MRMFNLSGYRISFFVLLLISFFFFINMIPLSAQETNQSPSVKTLDYSTLYIFLSREFPEYQSAVTAFKDAFKNSGVKIRFQEFNLTSDKEAFEEEFRSSVDDPSKSFIFSLGTPATKLAQRLPEDIPVVFTLVLYPQKQGIYPPGILIDLPCSAKLNTIKKILPDVKKIGLIYSSGTAGDFRQFTDLSQKYGVQIIGRKIDSYKEFASALNDMVSDIDCFLMLPDASIYFPQSVKYLLRDGLRRRYPVIGFSRKYTEAGTFASFDSNYYEIGEKAAQAAIRLMEGEKADSIGFIAPEKVTISLNLKVAEILGIKVSKDVEKEAQEVFGR